MGTVMLLPYTNTEILEVEYFVKHGHGLNDDPNSGLQVELDEFGRRAPESQHQLEKVFAPNLKSSVGDARWDEPLAKTVEAFRERSDERFQKACTAVRRLFGHDPEACEEAIQLARQMLTAERAATIASAAKKDL